MQDLEIKGTGNSRFLKSSVPATTTWEDFLTMLRAGNLPIDLTGLNSAGIITQNPSAYNKANVLPDDVCSALGIDPQTSEPKDAFLAAAPQVGDILTTTRTDLGDNWLLCNGDTVETSDYPNLKEVLPATLNGPWAETDLSTQYPNFPTKLYYVYRIKGTTFVIGSYTNTSTSRTTYSMAYTSSFDGTWKVVDLFQVMTNYDPYTQLIKGLTYQNGYYIIMFLGQDIGETNSSINTYNFKIMFTNDLDGTWTTNELGKLAHETDGWASTNLETVGSITYVNGYWAISVAVSQNVFYYYSSSLSGTFTYRMAKTYSSTYYPQCILPMFYQNGKYILAYSAANAVRFYGTDDLVNGTWTFLVTWEGNTYETYNETPANMYFGMIDGHAVFFVISAKSNYYRGARMIYTTDDSNATISVTGKELIRIDSDSSTLNSPGQIRLHKIGEYYIFTFGRYYAYAPFLASGWQNHDFGSQIDDVLVTDDWIFITYNSLLHYGGHQYSPLGWPKFNVSPTLDIPKYKYLDVTDDGLIYTLTDDAPGFAMQYQDNSKIILPEISLSDNTYTYIKAE